MRLIDADAEIARIGQEIKRMKAQIKEWKDSREDRGGYYNVDAKINLLKSNITQACVEIACLKSYSTAYDVDKVVEQLKCISQDIALLYPTDQEPDYEYADGLEVHRAIGIVKAGLEV